MNKRKNSSTIDNAVQQATRQVKKTAGEVETGVKKVATKENIQKAAKVSTAVGTAITPIAPEVGIPMATAGYVVDKTVDKSKEVKKESLNYDISTSFSGPNINKTQFCKLIDNKLKSFNDEYNSFKELSKKAKEINNWSLILHMEFSKAELKLLKDSMKTIEQNYCKSDDDDE
jgi:hypothetical protein